MRRGGFFVVRWTMTQRGRTSRKRRSEREKFTTEIFCFIVGKELFLLSEFDGGLDVGKKILIRRTFFFL